ncbi:MAG: hypothetical protein EA339_13085 [Rhodobacteraceae bacterium]|nr:MAG: hypothetical protein EA339_13085 [Paracoccaceae bacterium]
MRLICSIAAGVLISEAAQALDLPDCVSTPFSPESCVPVVACMPGDGVYLVGRALGWNEGTLEGVTNTGVACTGVWRVGDTLRLGHARFACEDGLAGQLVYHYQDPETGTARGTGLISGFGRIRAWSGHHIEDFLDRSGMRIDGDLMCGETPMLLSADQAAASPA